MEKFDIEKWLKISHGMFEQVDLNNPKLLGLGSVELNPTELCNRTCSFCPRSNPKLYPNQNLHMSLTTAQRLSDELYKNNFDGPVYIVGFGEPTLHKQILDVVKCFSSRFLTVLTTNGDTLVSGKMSIDSILESNLASMTVDCYDGDDHYRLLQDILKPLEGKIQVRIRNHHDNGSTDLIEQFSFTNRGGLLGEIESLKRPCNYPMYKMMIDWNGDMLLCCNDWARKEKGLGNIMKTPLTDLWNSDRLNSIRKSLLNGDRAAIPACAKCDIDGCKGGNESAELFKNKLLN